MLTRRLSRKEVTELGLYDFLGYIGAFNTPHIGGLAGTRNLIASLDVSDRKNFRVLEVGCATGYASCMLASEYGCQVVGIDLSEILIQKAQERARKMNLDNVEFRVANAMDLPFDDNSFDAMFGVAITALLRSRKKGLSEYMRVVRPGGKIGTLDLFLKTDAPEAVADQFSTMMSELLGGEVNIRTIDDWTSFYESSGLEDIKIQEFYENVLENPQERVRAVKATLKMVYHMIINKTIRKRMMRLMQLRKTAISQDSEQFRYLGYLLFTGSNPLGY